MCREFRIPEKFAASSNACAVRLDEASAELATKFRR
jgi:hypothetical protein